MKHDVRQKHPQARHRVGHAMRNAAERANRRAVNTALTTKDWDRAHDTLRPARVMGVLR